MQGNARLTAKASDRFQCLYHAFTGFHMDRDPICTCFGKFLDITLRLCDHQMDIKKFIRQFADRADDRESE